jgi:nucleoside-triphosphatase
VAAAAGHALLLTGTPGVGKTTVIRAVAGALAGWRLGGFYTEEMRAGAERRGFRLVTFDGRRAVMAHVDRAGPPRVGKYGVDVSVVDAVARSALALGEAIDLYLVDEVGKMECLSSPFVDATRALLDAGVRLVATIGLRGGGFIAQVKQRPDVTLWELTRTNRDGMPARVLAWIGPRGGT